MARSYVDASNADILNAVRANASLSYRERVTVATDNNIQKVASTIRQTPVIWNEFIDVLFAKVGLMLFNANQFENQLKPFKRGAMMYGGLTQEISTGLIQAQGYDPNDTNPFDADPAPVFQNLYPINRRDKYPNKINEDLLEEALVNDGQLSALLNLLQETPFKSAEWDEYKIMSQLPAAVYNGVGMATIKIPDIYTADDPAKAGQEIAAVLRSQYLQMTKFYNTAYNNAGVPSASTELIFAATPKFFGTFDTAVLAQAFNRSDANWISDYTVTIDDFGIPGCECMLIDRDWFVCSDRKVKATSIYNPATLDYIYYYHVWGTYAGSPQRNILALSTQAETNLGSVTTKTVEIIELAQKSGELKPGAEIEFTPTVHYSDGTTDERAYYIITATTETAAADGVWNVVLPDSGTYIDRMGVLHVADDSTYTAITVTAVADMDGSKTANVVINAG